MNGNAFPGVLLIVLGLVLSVIGLRRRGALLVAELQGSKK